MPALGSKPKDKDRRPPQAPDKPQRRQPPPPSRTEGRTARPNLPAPKQVWDGPKEARRDYPYSPTFERREELPNWDKLRTWQPIREKPQKPKPLDTWRPEIGPRREEERTTNVMLPIFRTPEREASPTAFRNKDYPYSPLYRRENPPAAPARPATLTRPSVDRSTPSLSSGAVMGGATVTPRPSSPLPTSDRLRPNYFDPETVERELEAKRARLRQETVDDTLEGMGVARRPPAQPTGTGMIMPPLLPIIGGAIQNWYTQGGAAQASEQRSERRWEATQRTPQQSETLSREREAQAALVGDSLGQNNVYGPRVPFAGAAQGAMALPAIWPWIRSRLGNTSVDERVAQAGAAVADVADPVFIASSQATLVDPVVQGGNTPGNVIGETFEGARDDRNTLSNWLPRPLRWLSLLTPGGLHAAYTMGQPEIEQNIEIMAGQQGPETIARIASPSGTMAEADNAFAQHEVEIAEAEQKAAAAQARGDTMMAAMFGAEAAQLRGLREVDIAERYVDPVMDTLTGMVWDVTNLADAPIGLITDAIRMARAAKFAGEVDEATGLARAATVLDAQKEIEAAQDAAMATMRAAYPQAFADEVVDAAVDAQRAGERFDYQPGQTVTWRNNDVDTPVTITGVAGEADGVRYYTIEGSNTGIPETQLIPPTAARQSPPTPKPAAPGAAPKPFDIRDVKGLKRPADERASKGLRRLFGQTTESLAKDRATLVSTAIQNLIAPVKGLTINDARFLIQSYADDPGTLIRGIPVQQLETDALRVMAGPDGLYRIGPGAAAPENLEKFFPVLRAAVDEILASPHLVGRGVLNKYAFMDDIDNAIYNAARAMYGRPRTFEGIPQGVAKMRVERVPGTGAQTGTQSMGTVKYFDRSGQQIGESAQMPMAEARRYKEAVKSAALANSDQTDIVRWASAPMNIQRAIMTDMFLGFRPANWVKNAGAAYGAMFADDVGSFAPMADLQAGLEKKMGQFFGNPRVFEAAQGALGGGMPGDLSHHWTDWFTGNNVGARMMRAYGRAAKRALNIPYGAGELKIGNVALPYGEQNFYTRIFAKSFEKGFNRQWPASVAKNWSAPLLKAGLPPAMVQQIADQLIDLGRTGSKEDVMRLGRKLISDNFFAPTLQAMGVNADNLPPALNAQLRAIFNQVTPDTLPDALKAVDDAFSAHMGRDAKVVEAAPPPPGPTENTRVAMEQDYADLEAQLADDMAKGGVPQPVADQMAKQVRQEAQQQAQQAVGTWLTDIVTAPDGTYKADAIVGAWVKFQELQRWLRERIDKINFTADMTARDIRNTMGNVDVSKVWREAANEKNALHTEYVKRLNGLMAETRLAPNADVAVTPEMATTWRTQQRLMDSFDAQANAAARGKDVALGAQGTKEYREIIEAGRDYVDWHMNTAFRTWLDGAPTMDGLDHLAAAALQAETVGHVAAGKVQALMAQVKQGTLPLVEWRAQSNAIWRDAFEQQAMIWETARKAVDDVAPFTGTRLGTAAAPVPAPAAAPTAPPLSPRKLQSLNIQGEELYRQAWDVERPKLVQQVTGGRATSAKELTDAEADQLIAMLKTGTRTRDALPREAVLTRDLLKQQIARIPNWTAEQVDAVMQLMDARARTWASLTGETAEDWYKAKWADVRGATLTKTEKGYKQTGRPLRTDTPAFRRWFGNSVLVDEAGQPKVFYHGSKTPGFTEFTQGEGRRIQAHSSLGFYFTDNADEASRYTGRGGGAVYPVYLKMENPKVITSKELFADPLAIQNTPESFAKLAKKYQAQGYDGLIFSWEQFPDAPTEYIIFDNRNIKSVNNRGTWSPTDPNILHKTGGGVPQAAVQFGQDGRAVVRAFRSADVSSLVHETWHVFDADMADIARRFPNTKAAQDYAALTAWAEGEAKRIGKWKNLDEGMREVIAEAGEVYLREGRAPLESLAGAFEAFKRWLTNIYRTLKGDWPNMSDEVRGIFDRALAGYGDEAVAQVDEVAPAAPVTPASKPALTGKPVQAWNDPARKYDMTYEVVEYDDLVISNRPDGTVNPAYPSTLQPRDRTQVANMQQVDSIAQKLDPEELLADTNDIARGSPVVGEGNVVASGNGRMMAFGKAQTAPYKQALVSKAQSLGLDPAAIQGMQNPVLVRRLDPKTDVTAFAREANDPSVLGYNAVEQGRNLAARLSEGDLTTLGASGAPTIKAALARTNAQEFVRRFMGYVSPNARAALMDAAGQATPQLADLVRSTLFSAVFKDDFILRNFVLALDPQLKNIGAGVESAIIKLALLQKQNPALAIGDELSEAASILMRIRGEGQSVDEFLAQIGMFEQVSPETAVLLRALDNNLRSGKAIGSMLDDYATAALKYDPRQAAMATPATPADAIYVMDGKVTTTTGRKIPVPPAKKITTDQTARNQIKAQDKWLHEQVIAEAEARGDAWNADRYRGMKPGKLRDGKLWTPAEADDMWAYLFGAPDVEFVYGPPPVPPAITPPPTKIDLLQKATGSDYVPPDQATLFQRARRRYSPYDPPIGDWKHAGKHQKEWTQNAESLKRTRNTRDAHMGEAAAADMRVLAQAQEAIHANLPRMVANPNPNTLTPAQRIDALNALQQTMLGWDNNVAAAQWLGNQAADFAMLNYAKRRNFDTILSMIMPYHYFWSRSAGNWAQRVLRKPSIANLYWEMENQIERRKRQNELANSGLPARVGERVPVGGKQPEWFTANPLNLLLPFNSYLLNQYVDPDSANNAFERAWLQARGAMPVGAPGYNLMIDAVLDQLFPREGPLSRTEEYGVGDIVPLIAQGTAWAQAFNGSIAPTWLSGDPYRIGLAGRQVAGDTNLTLEQRNWAMDVGYQLLNRVGPLPEQPDEAEAVWLQASEAAGFDKAMGLTLAFVLGLPFTRVRAQEREGRQALNTYRTLGYSEANPYGSAEAKRTFAEENDFLPYSMASYPALYPSRDEALTDPEGSFDRPGFRALRGEKDAEKEQIDAEYERRMNEWWAANENADPDVQRAGVNEIETWYREAKDAWEQKYAHLPTKEFPNAYMSHSPSEVQAKAEENAYFAARDEAKALVQVPPYPGDSGTDEQWDAWTSAREELEAAQLDILTRKLMDASGLSATVNGREVRAYSEQEARALAEKMLADISYMPEGKQAYEQQKDERQAEYDAREAEAMQMFGDDIFEIWDGYDKNWSKEEKAEYFDRYPQLSAFWDWWFDGTEPGEGQRIAEQDEGGSYLPGRRDKQGRPVSTRSTRGRSSGSRRTASTRTSSRRSGRSRSGGSTGRKSYFRYEPSARFMAGGAGGMGDFSDMEWAFPNRSYLRQWAEQDVNTPRLYQRGDARRIPLESLRSWL